MANKSKEAERQNKALQDIISGREHEKEYVQVGYEGKQEDLGGKTRKSELTDIMSKVRMPWFCPKCDKVMKKNIDDKMWRLYGHCSNCQVEFENRLAIDGKYNEWVKSVERENKLAWIRDQRETINEFKNTFIN